MKRALDALTDASILMERNFTHGFGTNVSGGDDFLSTGFFNEKIKAPLIKRGTVGNSGGWLWFSWVKFSQKERQKESTVNHLI